MIHAYTYFCINLTTNPNRVVVSAYWYIPTQRFLSTDGIKHNLKKRHTNFMHTNHFFNNRNYHFNNGK